MIESNDNSDYTFLQALFGADIGEAQVCSFPEDPQNIPQDRRGLCWYTHLWQDHRAFEPYTNRFFCISLFNPGVDDATGQPKVQRRRNLHRKTCVIALDDVVEKLDPLIVALLPRPTAILETSPGSHQWFYRVKQSDWALYSVDQVENLQDGLVASDLCPSGRDPGLKNVTRLVRLPSGNNTKARNVFPWQPNGAKCQLLELNEEVEVTLEEIAAPLGIDINVIRRQSSVNQGTPDQEHPVLQVVDVLSDKGAGCYDIVCPWIDDPVHGHTNPQDTSGTTIQCFADGNANLDCRHGHNEIINGRKPLMSWCAEQDGWVDAVAHYAAVPSEFSAPDSALAFAGYQGVGSAPPIDIGGVTFVAEAENVIDAPLATAIDSIRGILNDFFNCDLGATLGKLDTQPLVKAWAEMFYSPVKKATFMFNPDGDFVAADPQTVVGFIETIHGTVISQSELMTYVTSGARIARSGAALTAGDVAKTHKQIFHTFLLAVKIFRQRNAVSFDVDIFSDVPSIKLTPDGADVLLAHKPFAVSPRPTADLVERVLADYLEHFPQYREFIRSIAAARFAGNARKAYSWLHATSSWGKTFLLNGVLGTDGLDLVTTVSVVEIEKIFSGSPIGKSENDFIRKWIMFVDEVRYLTGDIKQLDREISGSPKHLLSFKARVYSKIFASAFAMDSVSGDTGVESQFVSRFSYLRPQLNVRIEDRELFKQLGATVYLKALSAWTADYLNAFVGDMRMMGKSVQEARILSANYCDGILNEYHGANSIEHHLGSLTDTLEGYALEMVAVAVKATSGFEGQVTALEGLSQSTRDTWAPTKLLRGYHAKYGEVVQILSPSKLVKTWLDDQVSKSEQAKLRASSHDVLCMMDVEGRGSRQIRLSHDTGPDTMQKGIIVPIK